MSDAQTTANNALQVAQAAGFKPVLLYDRGGRVSTVATETINLSEAPKNYLIVEYYTYNDQYSIEFFSTLVALPIPDYSDRHEKSFYLTGGFRESGTNKGYVERGVSVLENNTLSVSQCFVYAGSGTTQNSALIINRIWTI